MSNQGPGREARWRADHTDTAKRFDAHAPLLPNPRTGNTYKRAVLSDTYLENPLILKGRRGGRTRTRTADPLGVNEML